MKKIYIVSIPPTVSNYGYFYFLFDNCSLLKKHGLHYINIQKDKKPYRHIALQQALILSAASPDEDASRQKLRAALSPFEEWAKASNEDLLLCLTLATLNIQDALCRALHSPDFPVLSTYDIQFIYVLRPQSAHFEALTHEQKISFEERKRRYAKTAWVQPHSLYEAAVRHCGIEPRLILLDNPHTNKSEELIQSLDRRIPAEELLPFTTTEIQDRHALAFADWLAALYKVRSSVTGREIIEPLAALPPQTWRDPHTWTPPQLLQDIDAMCREENALLAQRVFHREELFQHSYQYRQQKDWTPYKGLTSEIRTQLLTYFRDTLPETWAKLQELFSCRWQYTLLPPEEKKLFPNPSSPQVLAQEPLVSVLTLTRNHVSMIAENMESILAQQTRFPFQHIIVDDDSRDGTPDIITEYAARHPRIIKPILLKRRAPDGENVRALFEQCRSKYAVLCDGDDYFTDPGKLQTQVDFMERNPDCALCFHPVSVVYEDGSPTKTYPPADLLPGGERLWYTLRDLLISNFIQTNSVMYRWRFQAGLPEWFDPTLIPGDWYWHLLHAETGKIAYLRKPMSAYRRHAASLYALAEKDHVAHRHQHGMEELHTYSVCNAHFRNRYYKDFSRLARGVFADFVQDYLKTKDDELLQKGIAAAPDFAKDFLTLLTAQHMALPCSKQNNQH